MSKTNKPRYVRLTIKNAKLAIEGRPLIESTIVAKKEDALMSCEKHISRIIKINSDCNWKNDFLLMCGYVGYFCEEKRAKQILELQELLSKDIDKEFENVTNACAIKDKEERYEAVCEAEIKYRIAIVEAKKTLLKYIRESFNNKFLPYAYVNFTEIQEYKGSYYNGEDELVGVLRDDYFSGIINPDDYVASIEKKKYINGSFFDSISISKPVEYLESCLNDNSDDTNFSFAIPITSKCNVGKRKALKAKETSN